MKKRQFERQAAQKLNRRLIRITGVDEDIATLQPAELVKLCGILDGYATWCEELDALSDEEIGF